jgi:superfamily II DNA or RNA helicase
MSHLELTRDLLMDAGGHVEMKKARAIHREGGVQSAEYVNGVLSGQTRVGGKMKRVSMEILSRTHMENHCTCLMVRQDGRVCAHVMAIGLEVIEPTSRLAESTAQVREDRWPKMSDEGNKIELSVMLPLHVEPSWKRDQIMVGFGATSKSEESLLSALSCSDCYQLDDGDQELWNKLKEIFPENPPGIVNLKAKEFSELLESLVGHPRVMFGKKNKALISSQGLRPKIRVRGEKIIATSGNLQSWQLDDALFRPLALGLPSKYQNIFGSGFSVSASQARVVLGELEAWFEVSEDLWSALPEEGIPDVVVNLEGSLRHLEARLEFWYNGKRGGSEQGEAQLVGEVLSNPSKEEAVVRFLKSWGFEGPARGGRMALRDREEILKFHAFAELPLDWRVERGERFQSAAEQIVAVRPDWEWRGSGQDWFSIETKFKVGEEELEAHQIQRMLRMGTAEQPFGRGKIAVVDADFVQEVNETLVDSEAKQNQMGVFEVSKQQEAFLRESAKDFGMAVAEEMSPPLDLPDFLRPYQCDGVRWMVRLSGLGMGGVLADDMGLGKTLQTLTYLSLMGGRSLVVCPSSLVENWAAEANKWFPGMKVACYVGSGREGLAEVDLVITSYAILRIDADRFRAEQFQVAVIDEAQAIKNPEAQITKVVHNLRAEHRFALSGTPVENSLQDLWSIMAFAFPGYLGPRKVFIDRFEKPLRTGSDPALARRLSRKLKPVVLRRLKSEVASDLPDRIELTRYCELTTKQKSIYQQILHESRNQIDAAADGQKRMVALTALLRLRQVCCDLRLLPHLEVSNQEAGVKLAEFESLVEEAVAGGHRVLVFSQFVQLLQGIVPILIEKQWDYCYLDGATKRRGEVVERFQEGKAPVFLISLKAGGVGLNLTAADTVIHLDPWWNPAVEAQATDRAHRIGQKKVVTSYKLITRGTVEEKIIALQEEKKKLLEAVLDGPGTLVPGLGDDELIELFDL